jgi:hypothetical protein
MNLGRVLSPRSGRESRALTPAPRARNLSRLYLGLTPQAVCFRPLRGLHSIPQHVRPRLTLSSASRTTQYSARCMLRVYDRRLC